MPEQRSIEMTRGMRLMEGRLGRPLVDVLSDLYVTRELRQDEVAAELKAQTGIAVDESTISRWLGRVGIETRLFGPRKVAAA